MGFFWSSTRVGAVEDRLTKVEERGGDLRLLERVEALEKADEGHDSRLRLIKTEWEDVLDRVNRVMGRLNARIRKSEAANEPESDTPTGPQGLPSPGSHTVLKAMRGRHGVLPR